MVNIIERLVVFFQHLLEGCSNIFFVIVSCIVYLIGYPAPILTLILVFFVLDFITKFYAIKVQNGGLIKAFMSGEFSSRKFWEGFTTKLLGYFVVLVMANLSKMTPEIEIIGNAISSILYTALFFVELVSNLENLRDAGLYSAVKILNVIKNEKDKFFGDSGSNKDNRI